MNAFQKILTELYFCPSRNFLLFVEMLIVIISLNLQVSYGGETGDYHTWLSSSGKEHFSSIFSPAVEYFGDMDNGSINRKSSWDKWKYQLPIGLTNRDSETSDLLPIDVTFAVLADEIDDPHRELRLVREVEGELQEVPFQLWNVSIRDKDTDGDKSRRTLTGTITFFDTAEDGDDSEYLLLYGNPDAEYPTYSTDLSVSGQAPELVIENARMTVTLHSSGQLSSIKLFGSEHLIDSPRGVIHWNPGVFIPTRYWTHSWDWDPPELVEVESGPVFVALRRSGSLPGFPEIRLSITYRFFTDRPIVESSSRIEFNEDLGVVSLRNDQLVFNSNLFSNFSWQKNDGEIVAKSFDDYKPINEHGDFLRIRPHTGFVAFFDEAKGIGAATVRLNSMNDGPDAGPPVLFDHATYITKNQNLKYWFRSLVYFNANWTREKLITIPRGSIYSERNLYLFFTPEKGHPVALVQYYRRAADHPPMINIGPYRFPPGN